MTNIACVTQPGYTSGWLMKKRGATHGITLFFIIQGLKLWILWIASISKVIRMNSYSNDTLHYYYFWPIWVALVTATGAMRLPSYAWPCSTRPAKVTALWHRCAVTHGCSSSWRAAFGSSWEDSRELCMWTCGSMRLGGTKAQLDEPEKSGESNCSVGM